MKKIILIAGRKRAGKNEISNRIIEVFNKKNIQLTELSFADELKNAACRIIHKNREQLEKLKNEEKCFIINKYDFIEGFERETMNVFNKYKHLFEYTKKLTPYEFYNNINFPKIAIESFAIINRPNNKQLEINARKILQWISIFKDLFKDDNVWVKIAAEKIKEIDNDIIITDYRFPNEKQYLIDIGYEVIDLLIIGKNFFDSREDLHISEIALDNSKFNGVINNTIYDNISIEKQIIAFFNNFFIDKNNNRK